MKRKIIITHISLSACTLTVHRPTQSPLKLPFTNTECELLVKANAGRAACACFCCNLHAFSCFAINAPAPGFWLQELALPPKLLPCLRSATCKASWRVVHGARGVPGGYDVHAVENRVAGAHVAWYPIACLPQELAWHGLYRAHLPLACLALCRCSRR